MRPVLAGRNGQPPPAERDCRYKGWPAFRSNITPNPLRDVLGWFHLDSITILAFACKDCLFHARRPGEPVKEHATSQFTVSDTT